MLAIQITASDDLEITYYYQCGSDEDNYVIPRGDEIYILRSYITDIQVRNVGSDKFVININLTNNSCYRLYTNTHVYKQLSNTLFNSNNVGE